MNDAEKLSAFERIMDIVKDSGSAEQASKAKSKLDTAGFESAFAPAKEPDESTLYQKIGRAIRTADDEPTPTPKAEPKPKRGHVCDTRCMGDSGHHSWPAPRPDECLCNQELAGRPVFCPSCANKPKPDQSGDITDMIPWPKDLNELMGKRITTRLPLSGGVFVTDVRGLGVLSRHLETTNVADNSKHIIDASHRDLLSIEPMPSPKPADDKDKKWVPATDGAAKVMRWPGLQPKPADEGKVESPPQSPAEAAREGEWLPNGMYAFDSSNTCAVLYHDDVRERDSQWRGVVREQTRLMQQASTMGLQLQESIDRLRAENHRQAGEIEELKKQSQIIREMPSR